jgi:hypothetical protein
MGVEAGHEIELTAETGPTQREGIPSIISRL